MLTRLSGALLTAAVLLGLSAPAAPANEVQKQLRKTAQQVADLLAKQDQKEVAIKEFSGPPVPKTSAGPMIQNVLIEELKRLKIGINDKAALKLGGEYFPVEEESGKTEDLTVKIVLILRNRVGRSLAELSCDINYNGNEDLVKLLGITADLQKHSKADKEGQNQQLRKQLEKSTVTIEGSKVKASPASPYAVEVLTRPANGGGPFRPLSPREDKGQAFAEIKKGEEYILRLYNASTIEAAATVTIDGIDAFQFFEPAQRRPTTFLIAKGQRAEVKGWLRNTKKANHFLVGSFVDSAAYKVLRGSASIGTITVCFHPCWEGTTPPPEYQGSRSAGGNATSIGKEFNINAKVVKRTLGPLVASVTIRYNK